MERGDDVRVRVDSSNDGQSGSCIFDSHLFKQKEDGSSGDRGVVDVCIQNGSGPDPDDCQGLAG